MGVFDIVMEKPAEVSQGDGCVWHSHGTTCWSQSHVYINHTHRFDGLQQVFPWLYQTHPSSWLTSADFSMTISNTPIASTDFSRFFHDYFKHIPLRRTSAGFSMTISSTHLFDGLQQVFPWLYQIHSPLRLTSAGFSMTISNTPIASTDFTRFFHYYQTYPTDFSRFFHDSFKYGNLIPHFIIYTLQKKKRNM
jgi:hypothetical protein